MKIQNLLKTLVILLSVIILYNCTKNEKDSVNPLQQSNGNLKNLRPAIDLADLVIDGFYLNGPIVQIGADFKIPLKIIEKNIGSKVSTGDSIHIYQRMPTSIPGFYTNRFAGAFPRPTLLSLGLTATVIGDIYVPKKFINPTTRKINLWSKADGGSQISEISETNNSSVTLWGIYMPIF